MAQLKQVCTVTNGGQTVTVIGVNVAYRIRANHMFMVVSELVPYTVAADAAFDGTNTVVQLTGAYQGPSNAMAPSAFVTDFTAPDNIPLISQGDVGTAAIWTKAMYQVQDLITSVAPEGLAAAVSEIQTSLGGAQQAVSDAEAHAQSASDSQESALGAVTTTTTNANVAAAAVAPAEAARDAAQVFADSSGMQAIQAAASAASAVAAATTAMNFKGIFATTAAGLSATAAGQGFAIPSLTVGGLLDVYLNSSGIAVLQGTAPTASAASTAGGFIDRSYDDDGEHIQPIRTGDRRLLRWFDYSGARRGKLGITQAVKNGLNVLFNPATGQTDVSFGTVEGQTPLGTGGGFASSFDDDGVHIQPILDKSRRLLRWFDLSGARRGKLATTTAVKNGLTVNFDPTTGNTDFSFGTVEGNTPIGSAGAYVSTYDDDGANSLHIVAPDANGVKRILMTVPKSGFSGGNGGSPAEITAARGTQTDLNTRMSVALNPYGAIKQPVYGSWFLRETRQRLRAILDGDTKTYVLGLAGDSWTDGSGLPTNGIASREYYYTRRLVMALQAQYGNAGAGWCCLKNPLGPATFGGSSNPNSIYQSGTGTWTSNTNNRPGASICSVQSSTPGDRITVTCTLTQTGSVALHYPTSPGVMRYRWNGGAWTQLDLSTGSGLQVAALTGFPTSAVWTLDIEPVSGTIELYGIDHRTGTSGIVVHGLGAGGSNAFHWGNVDQSQLQASWAALGINAFSMMLGTNDQLSYTVSGHIYSMQLMINTMRAAAPTADIVLATSPENSDTTPPRPTTPMSLFQEADLELAIANRCAHLNVQYYFGDNISEYGYGTTRGWLNSSLIHPSRDGQRVLEDAYIRLITQSV